MGGHKRSASLNYPRYKGLNVQQVTEANSKGYFLHDSLKDPSKDTVSRIKGDVLGSRFNGMLNDLTFRKTTSQLQKPMFGYFPKPGRGDTDRNATLNTFDKFTGQNSSRDVKNDKKHL